MLVTDDCLRRESMRRTLVAPSKVCVCGGWAILTKAKGSLPAEKWAPWDSNPQPAD